MGGDYRVSGFDTEEQPGQLRRLVAAAGGGGDVDFGKAVEGTGLDVEIYDDRCFVCVGLFDVGIAGAAIIADGAQQDVDQVPVFDDAAIDLGDICRVSAPGPER